MQGSVYCHNTHIRMSVIPREATGRRDSRMLILTGKGLQASLDATQWVKGVSSTLILGGVEKKLLRLRAIATESLGFLPNRPESGILLGAPIPLSRPLVELLRALVLCRTTQFAVIMRGTFLARAGKMPSQTVHCHPLPTETSLWDGLIAK